ncbi:MAG: hypothetical protein ACFFDN_37040 [Candidatus Hodarchaeota archaeon]
MAKFSPHMKFQIIVKVYSIDRDTLEELRQEIKTAIFEFQKKYGDSISTNNLTVRKI